jgi:hypothetical protein
MVVPGNNENQRVLGKRDGGAGARAQLMGCGGVTIGLSGR